MKKKYTFNDIIQSQDYKKVPSNFTFKFFFIPSAWPITWIALNFGISPNQATFIRFIIQLIAYFVILIGYSALGYFLFYLTLILDCVDGQIARVTNKATYFGKFFDGWLDCIFEISFPVFIGFAVFLETNDYKIIIISSIAGLMNSLYWITLIRYSLHAYKTKEIKVNSYLKRIFDYLDRRLLIEWFDIKYFLFPIFLILDKEVLFVIFLLYANSLLFIIFAIQRVYKGYLLFNRHRISNSQK